MYEKDNFDKHIRHAVFHHDKRELKYTRFYDADGNWKRTFRIPRQWRFPEFYTNNLQRRNDTQQCGCGRVKRS